MESERSVQLMAPLTARIYLEAYYDLSDPQSAEDLLPLLDEFNRWHTIPVATLQDTWPEGEWEEPEFDQGGGDEVAVPELEKPGTAKTLRDGAMATVLQALLDASDEDAGLLSEAELLTDFLPRLKDRLYEQANALEPSPHLLNLLCRALEDHDDVDLSPFKAFSAEDLSLVVSRLRKHGKMITLCVSNRPDVTEEDLKLVLRDAADLKALYILEAPQISVQGMSMFLSDCDLYHSDLLRQAIKPQPLRSDTGIDWDSDDVLSTGQACRGNDVSQLVWLAITERQALDKDNRLDSGLFDWKSLRQPKVGCSGSGLRYKRYPLDMPLPTFKTVAGLLRLLNWGSSSELYNPERWSRGAAFSFAMASSIPGGNDLGVGPVGGGKGFGIGTLGKRLYLDSTRERIHSSDAHAHLEPGRWAIVLIHEAFDAPSQRYLDECQRGESAGADSGSEDDNPLEQPKGGEQSMERAMALLLGPEDPFEDKGKNQNLPFRAIKRLRYALVTPSIESNPSGHEFIVADIPTYLEHVIEKMQDKGNAGDLQKLIEVWNSRIATIDTADFYGDEDIHDILPEVFPLRETAPSGSQPE